MEPATGRGMEYIRSNEEIGSVASALSQAPLFAADTEAAGYHRYHDRICLLQISTRDRTFLVDTLTVADLSPLGALFESTEHEVVLHDADYDLRLLHRDFGIRVGGLFDTKLAAQLIGESAFGLGALVEKYLGLRLDKKHQRADWAQRPLPTDMLAYAAEDTRHLPMLRDRLREELLQRGRLHWAQEEFALREHARWNGGSDDEAYLRVKNARDLTPRQLAAMRELYAWREQVAQKRDVATFRVVSNEILTALARSLPTEVAAVARTQGVAASIAERYGADMVDAVRRGLAVPEKDLPQRQRGPRRPVPDAELDQRVEWLKRARDAAAEELGLERGFLMPRHQLEAVARQQPKQLDELRGIPDIRTWQVEAMGERLIEALNKS
jgi:ribonuclease D